jgi:PTH1 family peptidyl-tRNA hydrolase
MSADKDLAGYQGHSNVLLGNTTVSITLFKPSVYDTRTQLLGLLCDLLSVEPLMNISGPSVLRALRKSVRSPNSLVVIHDSLEHRPQTLSYKFGGSANGHNGVKSIISSLSSIDFHRLRVGIGRDSSADPAVYVLRRFSPQEVEFWRNGKGLDLILKGIEKIASLSDSSGTIK